MKILYAILFVASCNYGWSIAISSKLDFNSGSREVAGTSILKSPKIQGVRVTVDTSKLHRSAESSSDEKETTSIDSKQKVGIRTDITFELDDDKNVSNSSSNENKEVGRDDDDNSNVPIYKGKPQPGEIPNPNRRTFYYEQDNRGFRTNGGNSPSYGQGPIYHTLDDENINYNNDWSHFVPHTGVWTTERNQYPNLNRRIYHNKVNGFNGVRKNYPAAAATWPNCNCNQVANSDEERRLYAVNNVEGIRRNSYNFRQLNQPAAGFHPGIDDKLEEPFKVDRGR